MEDAVHISMLFGLAVAHWDLGRLATTHGDRHAAVAYFLSGVFYFILAVMIFSKPAS